MNDNIINDRGSLDVLKCQVVEIHSLCITFLVILTLKNVDELYFNKVLVRSRQDTVHFSFRSTLLLQHTSVSNSVFTMCHYCFVGYRLFDMY